MPSRSILSHTDLLNVLSYNQSTGEFIWRAPKGQMAGRTAGSIGTGGYTHIKINGVVYAAHRLAWYYQFGSWPIGLLDHINCDRRDNRIANLRIATPSQNCANVSHTAPNKTGFKGIALTKSGRFAAYVRRDGRPTYLGTFDTPELAHAAYVKAAISQFGEFARF